MIKRLVKHGNSYALVIDKPIMELLQITPDTPFQIFTDGEVLLLKPLRAPAVERKLRAALDKMHQRFGEDLKRLAD